MLSYSVMSDSVTPWTVACQAPMSMGILQATILEWVAMPSSRESSQPRDQIQVSHIAGGFFTIWATRAAHKKQIFAYIYIHIPLCICVLLFYPMLPWNRCYNFYFIRNWDFEWVSDLPNAIQMKFEIKYVLFCRFIQSIGFARHGYYTGLPFPSPESLKESERGEWKSWLETKLSTTKIMTSGPITSWQIEREKVESMTDVIFLGSRIIVDSDYSHEIKALVLWKEVMTNLDSVLKSRGIILLTKMHTVKAMIFSSSNVQMWELDCKGGWVLKNWCFWIVVLEKTLESPLDCEDIKSVNPKGK